jgi:hypothetical protein
VKTFHNPDLFFPCRSAGYYFLNMQCEAASAPAGKPQHEPHSHKVETTSHGFVTTMNRRRFLQKSTVGALMSPCAIASLRASANDINDVRTIAS